MQTRKQRLKNLMKARRKWQNMSHSQRVKSREDLFQGAFHLPVETAVYVPSTTSKKKRISNAIMKKRVNQIRKYLSDRYGGYTSVNAVGGYVEKKIGLIKEPVVKVTAFTTEGDFKKNKANLKKMLKKIRKQWKQDSMGYEYEGDLYYIK